MLIPYINDNQKLWNQNLHKLACSLRTGKSEVTTNTSQFNFLSKMYTNKMKIPNDNIIKCDKITK